MHKQVVSTCTACTSLYSDICKVEVVNGYGVYLSKRQLNEAEDTARGSPTRLIRSLMAVFFSRDELASSSAYGHGGIMH